MTKYSSKEIIKSKDKILNFIYESGHSVTTGELAKSLKVDINLVSLLTEELSDNKFLESERISTRDSGNYKEFQSSITPKGIIYLMEGGALNEYKINYAKKLWSVILVIGSIVNAIAIISISYLTFKSTDTTNQLNSDLKKKEQTIDSLNRLIIKNDSLKLFRKPQFKDNLK